MSHPPLYLITGGAGFIGTHLVRSLLEQGGKVRVIDRRPDIDLPPEVDVIQKDIRDTNVLKMAMKGVHSVYHLAATVSVPLCQQDPIESYSNNFEATLKVLEEVRLERTPLIFASTAALYGKKGDDGRALSEEDIETEQMLSFYAAQKLASEQAVRLYSDHHKVPALSFRFFNVYGHGQDPSSPYSGVITIFMNRAKRGEALDLFSEGIQTRDFISVHDLVAALTKAQQLPHKEWRGQAINLGTGRTYTIKDLAHLIQKLWNSQSEIRLAGAREGDVMHSKANPARAKSILGFETKIQIEDGLKELLS